MSFKARFVLLGAFVLTNVVSGCTFRRDPRPNVLVVMVENLGFGTFSCHDTSQPSDEAGFAVFCDEAVRYTHAYTPTPLSQAAVASILTGLYPREHGLRHNGPQALPASIATLPETAREAGYATYFVSGGAPIWRRSGFSQGFDEFDDNVQVALRRLYRTASANVRLFLSWQANEAAAKPWLSFLYFADAQFPDEPTFDEVGEVRESSYRGQLNEISDALLDLSQELKRRKLWDSTYVILLGLDGHPDISRVSEPEALNLYSESTRVTLMIKPARKKRDAPLNWKIDSNVSLVDVGQTIFDLIDSTASKPVSKLGAQTLTYSLEHPTSDWKSDRKLVIESAWSEWRGIGPIRSSVRMGPYLYVFDERGKLYDTLTDSLEEAPIPATETRTLPVREELHHFLQSMGYSPWSIASAVDLERLTLGEDLWRERPMASALPRLQELAQRYPDDAILRGWRAVLAVRNGDWKDLKAAAEKAKGDGALWSFVAGSNLGEKLSWPDEPCFRALKRRGEVRRCADDAARELLTWSDESTGAHIRDRAREAFMRRYLEKALSEAIARQSFVAGDQWDIADDVLRKPALVDLLLALPEMRKFRAVVRARVSAENAKGKPAL